MPTDGTGNPKVERRLAAILAADIASYSALMGADEARTVRDLKAHQSVVLPMIAEHGGRIIDTAGDGILAEFGSVVNAVECAVTLQKTMAERNSTIEATRQMQFRIGINLGDVIHDEARVYGDGVNIAARLEGIAQPGGSYEHVHNKLPLAFTDIGEQQLKNIASAVRIYRIELHNDQNISPSQEKKRLSLPDKPSIAVLPFTNMSGDASQEYFSDGITEDIITELSRFSELFVIARNSSFQYKGKSPDIRQVGRDLGVRYVLEGSIRRAGDRVRITGQLIDAATGAHRWAERYDRKLEDVFAVQDEVARTIVAILAAHVNKAEAERTLLKPPAAWQAHDYYMQGTRTFLSFGSSWKAEDFHVAQGLFERSFAVDPHYARAYSMLSLMKTIAWANPLHSEFLNPSTRDQAYQLAAQAVRLDENLPQAQTQLGYILTWMRQYDASIAAFERAVLLNPNLTDYRFAGVLTHAGEFERAIDVARVHMRLDPFYSSLAPAWQGLALYMLKRYAEALPCLQQCVARSPNFYGGHVWLAATYAQLDRITDARSEVTESLQIDPKFTIEDRLEIIGASKHERDREHLIDGLRKAGFPEK